MFSRIKGIWKHNMIYKTTIWNCMKIEPLFNYEVKKLSGGEL